MRVAVIDAEIIGKSKHRFPNLCCMKLSSYHKGVGDTVELKLDYENLDEFDKVYISKVFTATDFPEEILTLPNVEYGGTGFYYDEAPSLPYEVEHAMPDYHLYDDWVAKNIERGVKRLDFKYYLDYSIGYLTRGCFRHCEFCVNRNSTSSCPASTLCEFMNVSRPKLCFLDDNFFACKDWKELIEPVVKSGKAFQFKQGLDERLLTEEKILAMSKWKYDSDMIFAFDNLEDKDLVIEKLKLIRSLLPDWKRGLKFYVFCGWDKSGVYDAKFWERDINGLFERIAILREFDAKPYVMRFEKAYDSEFSTFYATVASWCNQPSLFKTFSFRLYAQCRGMSNENYAKYKRDVEGYLREVGKKGGSWRAMEQVEELYPRLADKYFDADRPPFEKKRRRTS